ncbi:MAG: NAD-dependent epimerase/dehydratase family protein [Roseovarius sp.]
MRILVTGSGGRLGRLLFAARKLSGPQTPRFIFQSRKPGRDLQWSPDMPLGHLPNCDVIIALWGVTSGSDNALAENAALVETTRRTARACGAERVFHLSSAAVYGPGAQMSETTETAASTAYGKAKIDMEAAVRAARDTYRHCVLRLANVVGADSLAPALLSHGDVTLDRFADGHGPRRSYIGATDLLRVFRGLSELDADLMPPAINIAAADPVSMEDLAVAAGKAVIWRPAPVTGIQDATLDVTRMRTLLPEVRPASDPKALWDELRRLEDQS